MNHPAIRSNAILFKRLQTFDFLGDVDDTILTAIALGESGVWSIPRHAPEEIVLTHLQTAMQIIESMADMIIELVALIADLSLETFEARFAKLLLAEAEGM